jgi:hypothetical protein
MDDTSQIVDLSVADGEKETIEPEKTIRCRGCEHEITKPSLAIQPHEHTFTNPFGLVFHIVCYGDAPGANSIGEPTKVATWFPGYAWTMGICKVCSLHVGWWFQNDDRFIGLIVGRIIRD